MFPSSLSLTRFVATCALISASGASAQWSIVNIHPTAASYSNLYSVNTNQQCGQARINSFSHASIWSESADSWIDLHPFTASPSSSEAFATNGVQQVGRAVLGNSPSGNHASLWSGTVASWVDLNPPGARNSIATALWGDTQVGQSNFIGLGVTATLWRGSAASFVLLNPANSTTSEALGVAYDQQVGRAVINGTGHASLWRGTSASWISLNPPSATDGYAQSTDGSQQAGWVQLGGAAHASLWSGSAASWIDLHPAPAASSYALSTNKGLQVGFTLTNPISHASLWSGSVDSWVDLHTLLPSNYTTSTAYAIWSDATSTYIGGYAFNSQTTRTEAIIWKRPAPQPCVADFNQDGGIDGSDLEAFFTIWETGAPAADVNLDGGTDGQDIETFITRWVTGAC
ncbi:MAG: hypothetical protein NTV94_16140 [Planctomycetota bacterium]|nr:hypothetical protein [Planctomycetota bacterium]